jgi:hypothetical protein
LNYFFSLGFTFKGSNDKIFCLRLSKDQLSKVFNLSEYIFLKVNLKKMLKISRVKSVSKNQKRTKKMSNFQNRRPFMKNTFKFPPSHHYGLVNKNNNYKSMMTVFNTFLGKRFRDFFFYHINGKKGNRKSPLSPCKICLRNL